MYTLKVSYGYVDEPETATTEILGAYATWEEACEAAESKFSSIIAGLVKDCELCFGEVESSRYAHYVTHGYFDCEIGSVSVGYSHYYKINFAGQ